MVKNVEKVSLKFNIGIYEYGNGNKYEGQLFDDMKNGRGNM